MKPFRKTIAMLIAFVLLLTAAPVGPVSADDTPTVIPDGEYAIGYRYVKDGTTQNSAANQFVLPNTGKLIVKNGQATFEHEITKMYYATFAYLGSRKAGANKAVITSSGGEETVAGLEGYQPAAVRDAANPNNVVVSLYIEDVWKKQDILIHIYDKENIFQMNPVYNHWYNVQLELNLDDIDLTPPEEEEEDDYDDIVVTIEMFNERATVARSVYENAREGESDGFYPFGSRAELYDSIVTAERIAASAGGNAELLKAAYIILDESIKKFESLRIVVDKSKLIEWIAKATAWTATAADGGTAESGKPGHPNQVAVSDGEYPADTSVNPISGPATKVRASIAQAQSVVNDVYATQAEVDSLYNTLYFDYNWEDLEKQRYIASTVNILVLDSIGPDAKISPYANEILPTAVLLQQTPPYYEAYANITFLDPEGKLTASGVQAPTLSAPTGLFLISSSTGLPSFQSTSRPLVKLSSDETHKVYQGLVRSGNRNYLQDDTLWQGLWALKYPKGAPASEQRIVYISFNADLLAALNELIDEAKQLHDNAVVGTAVGQYPASYVAKLQEAIDQAEPIGNWLAAPRPQILKATADLQAAMDELEAAKVREVYFSVAHATKDAFSAMENYFQKPAVITTADDGSRHATVTIKGSASVPEFKIKRADGEFVEAATVSEDTASNTRVVTFPVDDLSALLEAKVRTVVPAQNVDQTHDIRLNFNNVDNSALYQAIETAKAVQRAAVEGTEPGQYPPGAKAALQSAIDAADAEATRLHATDADTAAALSNLQQALELFKASQIIDEENPNPEELADGEYTLDFMIYKNGTNEPSVMYNYVDPKSGRLTVTGGKKYVSFTLKQNAEIVSFKTEVRGVLTETETVSVDPEKNTRVVRFEVEDLSAIIDGWVKVYWELPPPIGVYDEEYEVDIGFSNIVPVEEEDPGIDITKPLADGEYSFTFTASTSGDTPISDLVDSVGKLNVAKGKKTAVITLKPGVTVTKITMIIDGTRKELYTAPSLQKSGMVTILAAEASGNPFEFEAEDLTATYELELKDKDGETHTFELRFKKVVAVHVPPSNSDGGKGRRGGGGKLSTPSKSFNGFTDGKYSIDFAILKKGTSRSSEMMDYVRTPGTLRVENGAQYVSFTLEQSAEVTHFRVKVDGIWKATNVIETDDEANTRVVEFEVKDLNETVEGWVRIVSVERNYYHEYDVDLTFDVDSVKPLQDTESPSPGTPTTPEEVQENAVTGHADEPAVKLTDIGNHWAKSAIEQAVTLGIVSGYEDGTFRPDNTVKRSEFAVMISRALKLGPSAADAAFADADRIPGWAKPYVAQVVGAGIVSGYEDNTFRADRQISRAEIAVMIVRALGLEADADAAVPFADAEQIPVWARGSVAAAAELGIIHGRGDNRFAPNEPATRGEAVTLILSMLNHSKR